MKATIHMKTPLGIEKHASILYTITAFYKVQEEICASCFKCMVLSVREDGGMLLYDIMDGKNKIFTVVHNVNDHEAKCSCKMFEMVGQLYIHIFVVFRDLEKIPLKYVVNRWTKDASLKASFEIDGVIYDQNRPKDEKKMLLNKLWYDVHCCIDLAGSNMEQLDAFSQVINEQKQLQMSGKEKLSPQHSRKTVIESFCGSIEISEINILPPKHAKNKGSGKRIKSSNELAMEKEKSRRCNFCGVRGDQHDTRTCPLNSKNKDKQQGKKKHPTCCQPATMLNSQPWMMFGCGMMSLKLRMTNDVSGLECVVFVVSYNHYKLEGEEDEKDIEDEE
ncbi:PREDICTED: protein FAR1-RELATED SEQUENCE 5-like [Ipomoea nil]|uniref:protein FAR1-RELATED SEQUENCE 5-like n=1 Tax=Ipomoea nil TaxID=35883 RepID=UPI0009016566|nr:PREDICTED: protein FAR1-RELATED SEQUENCE 5-like [Ipomoea nil]